MEAQSWLRELNKTRNSCAIDSINLEANQDSFVESKKEKDDNRKVKVEFVNVCAEGHIECRLCRLSDNAREELERDLIAHGWTPPENDKSHTDQ